MIFHRFNGFYYNVCLFCLFIELGEHFLAFCSRHIYIYLDIYSINHFHDIIYFISKSKEEQNKDQQILMTRKRKKNSSSIYFYIYKYIDNKLWWEVILNIEIR